MKAVGVRDLKNRLSEYLRAVRRGERILVTDRGQVVAELRSPAPDPESDRLSPALARLVRDHVTLGLPNGPQAYPPLPAVVPEGTADRLIDELRGER